MPVLHGQRGELLQARLRHVDCRWATHGRISLITVRDEDKGFNTREVANPHSRKPAVLTHFAESISYMIAIRRSKHKGLVINPTIADFEFGFEPSILAGDRQSLWPGNHCRAALDRGRHSRIGALFRQFLMGLIQTTSAGPHGFPVWLRLHTNYSTLPFLLELPFVMNAELFAADSPFSHGPSASLLLNDVCGPRDRMDSFYIVFNIALHSTPN